MLCKDEPWWGETPATVAALTFNQGDAMESIIVAFIALLKARGEFGLSEKDVASLERARWEFIRIIFLSSPLVDKVWVLRINSNGEKHIPVIKALRNVTNLGLKEALTVVRDGFPIQTSRFGAKAIRRWLMDAVPNVTTTVFRDESTYSIVL